MADEEESKPLLKGRQKFVLEIISCVYFFARFATLPLIQQYVYFLVERKHNVTKTSYGHINAYIRDIEENSSSLLFGNGSDTALDSEVRYDSSVSLIMEMNHEASSIVLRLTLAECLPAAVSIIVFGFSSDVIGKRKFLMWLPCFGNCLFVVGFVLPEYISHADLDSSITMACFYVACIISGLSGSTAGYLSGSASYISDVDSPEKRTERLALIEMVIGLTFGLAALVNGSWISYSDHFEVPMWTIIGLSFVAGICILCFLPEPYPKFYQIHESMFNKVTEVLAQGKKMCTATKLGLDTYFVFASFLIYAIVQHGQERTYVLFLLNRPLSWTPMELGAFLCLVYVLAGLGSWPGFWLLHKCLSDLDIFMLSLISMFFGTLTMVVSQNILVIYFSAIIKLFHLLPYAISRSYISQQVDKDNQGSINAIVHSLLAISSFAGPVLHVWIFTETLNVSNGFSFILSAILIIPAFSLLLFLKCRDGKQTEYSDMGSVVYDPQLKDDDGAQGKYNPVAESSK